MATKGRKGIFTTEEGLYILPSGEEVVLKPGINLRAFDGGKEHAVKDVKLDYNSIDSKLSISGKGTIPLPGGAPSEWTFAGELDAKRLKLTAEVKDCETAETETKEDAINAKDLLVAEA